DSLGASDGYFMHQEGMLEPLEDDRRERFIEALGADKTTEFGFTFANLGYVIACNNETVEVCPATIDELFDSEGFPGRRSMPGESYSQFVSAAIAASGEEAGSTDFEAILEPVRNVRDSVAVWYTSG